MRRAISLSLEKVLSSIELLSYLHANISLSAIRALMQTPSVVERDFSLPKIQSIRTLQQIQRINYVRCSGSLDCSQWLSPICSTRLLRH